ncbi:MAG: condensation domain-containing protein, partial [Lacticaseibacillus paracasei]
MPLSFAQQRLWFLYRLEGPSPTYNIPLALHLRGHLDPKALQDALQDVISRHESLRTLFVESGENACQNILSADDGHCRITLQEFETTQDNLANSLARLAAYSFRLEQEIPLRAALIRLSSDHHVLLVLMHHIASDGWSMAPLLQDLATSYGARQRGRVPDTSPLPVQYADYTLWQRSLLGDGQDPESRFSQQADYWRKTLAGLPDCITLPTDRPRPELSSYQGARIPLVIDATITKKLKQLARYNGASLFMVLQAALAVLLGKMGAGDDITIGTPIAGRTDSALEDLVGFFVNTLVLRIDLSSNPDVGQLIAQVRDRSLSAYAHQDLPFERLVEILNPTRAQNHHPLFQVMLVLQNLADADISLPGLDVTLAETEVPTAKFDLTVGLSENGDTLQGDIEYSTDLFDERTVVRLSERFLDVLREMTEKQDIPVLEIDILSEAERHLLLETWNETTEDVPSTTLPALFEAQAALTPDATAVVYGTETLTYSQLNTRANQIAHYLISAGVSVEDTVALCVERGLPMIAGLLGILKAGAAYVPLDPAYPSDRLALILADADPHVILTDAGGKTVLGEQALATRLVLRLDDPLHMSWLDDAPSHNPVTSLSPDNLAYVIYTSGSTGTPKGVMVEHRQISSTTLARISFYKEYSFIGSSCLLLSSYAFDSSIATIFGCLSQGSSLHIISEENSKDAVFIGNYLINSHITWILCVPRLLSMLNLSKNSTLMCGIVAGEEVSAREIHKLLLENKEISYYNEYGPTEGSVWATVHKCQTKNTDVIPIGRPIMNARIYILDAR